MAPDDVCEASDSAHSLQSADILSSSIVAAAAVKKPLLWREHRSVAASLARLPATYDAASPKYLILLTCDVIYCGALRQGFGNGS
jgi:hypothetical protein